MSFPDGLIDKIVDVQGTRPSAPIPLNKVGVKGHAFKLTVLTEHGEFVMYPRADLYVDLPSEMRGAHLSRSIEALYEVLKENPRVGGDGLADFCSALCERLLDKHEYATASYVRIRGEYLISRGYGPSAFERFEVFSSARSRRAGGGARYVGVKVMGMTSCPCSQNLIMAWNREDLKAAGVGDGEISRILERIPAATHTQRTEVVIELEVPFGSRVNVDDLIDIAERSLSAPTYALLKRPPEASLLMKCLKSPKFAEDVARDALSSILNFYRDMPDWALVALRVRSLESVHKHDIVVEHRATFGELRGGLKLD